MKNCQDCQSPLMEVRTQRAVWPQPEDKRRRKTSVWSKLPPSTFSVSTLIFPPLPKTQAMPPSSQTSTNSGLPRPLLSCGSAELPNLPVARERMPPLGPNTCTSLTPSFCSPSNPSSFSRLPSWWPLSTASRTHICGEASHCSQSPYSVQGTRAGRTPGQQHLTCPCGAHTRLFGREIADPEEAAQSHSGRNQARDVP